jgi:hypothetical protein
VRVLRSARHGEWENVAFLVSDSDDHRITLKYRLVVQDIGCVIRAICITDGGGTPLMITSSERVQPSTPRFLSAAIVGQAVVGMPMFAVAEYAGGIQGRCRYDWSIGTVRPVIVPDV